VHGGIVMKKSIICILVATVLLGCVTQVEENQFIVILNKGRIVNIIDDSDTYKKRLFEYAILYPKEIQVAKVNDISAITRDKRIFAIEISGKWMITDPEQFYISVDTLERGTILIQDMLENSFRTTLAGLKSDIIESALNENASSKDQVISKVFEHINDENTSSWLLTIGAAIIDLDIEAQTDQ
jgi:regulator of protease activity HflC (stomatin/prohibitin superfamily)